MVLFYLLFAFINHIIISRTRRQEIHTRLNPQAHELEFHIFQHLRGDYLTAEMVSSPDLSHTGYLAGPIVLAQDSRLGAVARPIPGDGIAEDAEVPSEEFHLVKRLSDGTLLCDYASAGNRFALDNRLTVWMKKT